MAAASNLVSGEQFLCSICLDMFTDPVTIPCGHNYCKNCITQAWEMTGKCQCPICKELFNRRPGLRVNTVLHGMADQFRKSVKKKSITIEQNTAKGDVPCDVCTETRLMAVNSCLVCLTSYCETHLEPHHRVPGLKRHQLIDPVDNLEGRMCKKHERPLQLFCRTDQMCVCQLCIGTGHKRHHFAPLKKEYEQKMAELDKTEAEVQQMIQERRLKIQQIKQSVKLSKEDADKEAAASVQVFTALIQSVERSLDQLLLMIEEKQKTTEKQAEGFIKELEEEIAELMKRSSELEQLSHTEDHLQFLQSFPSMSTVPPTKDWTQVTIHSSCEEAMSRALVETLGEEVKKLCSDIELKRVQQYAVDVTLDPDTAHPALILSENKKCVSCGDVKKNVPDNSKRFSSSPCVLGKQSFSSGRFYYEVQIQEKIKWELGVARESINRKGYIAASPSTGFWVIWLRNGNEYRALDDPGVSLSLESKPQKVGVFVDYEEGLVSFYDVEAATLIYSFTDCNFTEKVFPVFGPGLNDGGKNSAPVIICSVSQTD